MNRVQDGNPARLRGAWPLECCSRKGGLAVSALLVMVGGFFAIDSLTLTFGDLDLPGPGFFPFVLGLALIGLSIAIFILTYQEPRDAPKVELGHSPVLIAFIGLCAMAAFFEFAGALLALGAFTAAMLVLIGRVRILPAILSSVVAMLAVWFTFKVLLGVQLPAGLLEGWL